MRPYQVMDAEERRIVEQVSTRVVIQRMVKEGIAEWIPGRRAVRLIDRTDARELRVFKSGLNGPTTVQLTRV